MYESYFGLRQRPFSAAPLVSRYVPLSGIEQARSTVSRCIERAEGPALVIGPAGSGKTLLCYLLADAFAQQFQPVLLFSGHLSSRKDLLQAILFELDLPYRGLDEGELRLALLDYLTRSPQCPNGILLVVDEAHALPPKLLEELRLITNVARGGQPRVRLVLVGAASLEERLASPKLESFSQRLAARCYLEPLDRSETAEFIQAQLRMAGADPQRILTPQALDALYRASDGIPRLINQLCDHALLDAAQHRHSPVDAATVEKAWANLQQLPSPWVGAPTTAHSAASIEFGALDDDESSDVSEPSEVMQTDACFMECASESYLAQQPTHPAEERLEHCQQQLECLGNELVSWDGGEPEVELVFDEPAAEASELFEISLSQSSSLPHAQQPEWHSTEFCAPEPAAHEHFPADSVAPYDEGGALNEDEFSEEVVVDRYAKLDALKRQGSLPQPQLQPAGVSQAATSACPRPAAITAAAEKSLTLAEALVQHAATLEHNGCEPCPSDQFHSCQLATGAGGAFSVDLLPPGAEQTPPAPDALEGLTVEFANQADEDELAHEVPCVPLKTPAAARDEEPDLIVIDDEAPGLQVQAPVRATPVKRQEYRQLFARLRRG